MGQILERIFNTEKYKRDLYNEKQNFYNQQVQKVALFLKLIIVIIQNIFYITIISEQIDEITQKVNQSNGKYQNNMQYFQQNMSQYIWAPIFFILMNISYILQFTLKEQKYDSFLTILIIFMTIAYYIQFTKIQGHFLLQVLQITLFVVVGSIQLLNKSIIDIVQKVWDNTQTQTQTQTQEQPQTQ